MAPWMIPAASLVLLLPFYLVEKAFVRLEPHWSWGGAAARVDTFSESELDHALETLLNEPPSAPRTKKLE